MMALTKRGNSAEVKMDQGTQLPHPVDQGLPRPASQSGETQAVTARVPLLASTVVASIFNVRHECR